VNSPKRILIIEDELVAANVQRNTFIVEGYQVDVANDGKRGMELLDQFKPHLIVLDLLLPDTDGVELIKKIRCHKDFKEIPIIVSSNFQLSRLVENAWKAGASHCITKANCTRKELVSIVKRALASEETAAPTVAPELANARTVFFGKIPGGITALRSHLQQFIKAESDRPAKLAALQRELHGLHQDSTGSQFKEVAHFFSAFGDLLKELHENPDHLNASTMRTVAQGVDFSVILLERSKRGDAIPVMPEALIVDDEIVSCRLINIALQKAMIKTTVVHNPVKALEAASKNPFKLFVLDVNMPEMSGFDLCTSLRKLPVHAKTPVIFITGLNDFVSRAKSTLSGGNEFIAKPFLVKELSVKALTYALR
jgi:DNA-binding response OmpR family regulator